MTRERRDDRKPKDRGDPRRRCGRFSRLAAADEDRTLARLRALRSDLIDPTIAVHKGRVVKRTGDGLLVEFRSVVEAVAARSKFRTPWSNATRRAGRGRIIFRIGVHLGDVVEEGDGHPWRRRQHRGAAGGCSRARRDLSSEDAYRQVKGRLDLAVLDLGPTQLKNIAEPIRVYSLEVGAPAPAKPAPAPRPKNPPRRASRSSSCRSPISAATRSRSISSMG